MTLSKQAQRMKRPEIRKQPGRGAGKSFKALAALPDGGTYVIAAKQLVDEFKVMLDIQGRRSDAVEFRAYRPLDALRGRSGPIAVDHRVWEICGPDAYDTLRSILKRP